MVVKHCAYGICVSDSRYMDKPDMKGVTFVRFPDPVKERAKCKRWVKACNRIDFELWNVTYFTFICTKHFFGGSLPTVEHPDPIPCTTDVKRRIKAKPSPSKRSKFKHDFKTLRKIPRSSLFKDAHQTENSRRCHSQTLHCNRITETSRLINVFHLKTTIRPKILCAKSSRRPGCKYLYSAQNGTVLADKLPKESASTSLPHFSVFIENDSAEEVLAIT